MTQDLIIWLPDQADLPWAWTRGQDSGWAETEGQRRALAGEDNRSITVICPGQWVRMYPHDLPDMRASEKTQAAGYAIEDQLAAPLAEQHIILGAGEDRRVGVIGQDKMDQVLEMLAEAGLSANRLIADFDAMPEGAPRAVLDREVHGGRFGYALDQTFDSNASLPSANSLDLDGALNFLQGRYQARRNYNFDKGGLTRIAALFVATGLCWLLWQGAQIRAMNHQADALKAQMAERYQAVTGEPAPNNIARVVNRARADGKTAQIGFMDLSAALFNGLKNSEGVMVDTMRYDQARNELVLRLIYPRFETASELEATYSAMGFAFQSGAVRERGDDLIGEAVLTQGGRS